MAASFAPTREMIDAVEAWYAHQLTERIRRPIIPHLQERFDLDPVQAVTVIQAARKATHDASK